MINRIKRSLTTIRSSIAPKGMLDNDTERTGWLLTLYIWTFMVVITVLCIGMIILSPEQAKRPLLIILGLNTLYLLLYALIKRKMIHLANILTIGVTWLLLTGIILTGGGIHSAAYVGYFMLTFLAGVTLGGRTMVVIAIASTFSGFGFEYMESIGVLPEPRYTATHFQFTIIQGVMLLLLVLMQYYASWLVKKALTKAQDELNERKLIEKSLLESNERFDQIAKHIPEVFWISERIGGLVYVSPAFESIYGSSADELYRGTKQHIDFVHPDDHVLVNDAYEHEIRGEALQLEYRIVRPNGEIRWIYDRAFPVLDPKGQLLRTIGIASDITEQKQREAERRELLSTLEDAEEQVGLASWSQDVLEHKGRWSTHMFTLFGFDPAQGIPSLPDFLEHIHPEDRAILGGALSKMFEGQETPNVFLYRTNPAYGEMRILKPSYRVETNASGQITKFFGTVLDITERKRAEAELEYRQKLLEKVIHAGKNITSIIDPDSCFQQIHHNIITNLGFDRVGLFLVSLETNLVKGAYGTDRNGRLVRNDWYSQKIDQWSDWETALQSPTGITFDEDYQATHNPPPEDEMYGVKQHVTLAAWAGEKPVALITVDNLLTGKPIAPADLEALQLFAGYAGLAIENAHMHTGLENLVEERTDALSQSQKSLQLFLDTANDLIQSLDENGQYIYVNQTWCNILGYSSEEAKEMNMLQVVDKEYQEHCLNIFNSLMVDGKSQIIEVGFRTRQGNLVIVEGSISVQMRNDGKRITNGFFRDVTERKRAEIAMRQANIEMERALRMKDEFLTSMSHELRTPLNSVLGLSESLLEETVGPINSRQQRYLKIISESGGHLLSLINDILDLAKIEAGHIHLEITKVNVHHICKASRIIVEPLAKSKLQTIELQISESINTIQADERRLKQMIVNLLSNAIKFTPNGGKIGIKASIDSSHARLLIEVWDTGIGIRQQDMEHLFQPFVQLDAGLARESSGTGLGLALVAQMARMHGGTVIVDSEFGKGSRFTLNLPLVAINHDSAPAISI